MFLCKDLNSEILQRNFGEPLAPFPGRSMNPSGTFTMGIFSRIPQPNSVTFSPAVSVHPPPPALPPRLPFSTPAVISLHSPPPLEHPQSLLMRALQQQRQRSDPVFQTSPAMVSLPQSSSAERLGGDVDDLLDGIDD